MNKISDLTYKMVAFSEVPNFAPDECIDWAQEMLALGYDTPNLLMLAGMNQPGNYFEAIAYMKNAMTELGIPILNGNVACQSYASYFIKRIANSVNVMQNLSSLYDFSLTSGFEDDIFDFRLLLYAWEHLETSDEPQWDWIEATKENIESLVVARAQKWLLDNASSIPPLTPIVKP